MADAQGKFRGHQEVSICHKGVVRKNIKAHNLVSEIKHGRLEKSDKISIDGKKWIRLDRHPQLSQFFKDELKAIPSISPTKNKNSYDKFESQDKENPSNFSQFASQKARASASRKKLKILFALLFFGLLSSYIYFLPHITIYKIQSAIKSKDIKELSQYVDYPALRQNFKNQINSQMISSLPEQIEDNPFSVLAIPLAQALTDKMIDAMVTPEALIAFSKGRTSNTNSQSRKDHNNSTAKKEKVAKNLFSDSEFHYVSFNKFTATMKGNNAKDIEFVFERSGIDWKITGINLPFENSSSSTNKFD